MRHISLILTVLLVSAACTPPTSTAPVSPVVRYSSDAKFDTVRDDVQNALLTLWRMTLPVHHLSLDDYALEVGATPDYSGLASPEYLPRVLRHCAWVGRLLRHAAQDVSPPSGLADVVRSFRAHARELGLQLGTAPLVLAGKRRRIACRARVKRVARAKNRLKLGVGSPSLTRRSARSAEITHTTT